MKQWRTWAHGGHGRRVPGEPCGPPSLPPHTRRSTGPRAHGACQQGRADVVRLRQRLAGVGGLGGRQRRDGLPADPERVAEFLADMSTMWKISTIRRRLASLSVTHTPGARPGAQASQTILRVQCVRTTRGGYRAATIASESVTRCAARSGILDFDSASQASTIFQYESLHVTWPSWNV